MSEMIQAGFDYGALPVESASRLQEIKRGSPWINPQPRIIGASVFDSFFDSIGRFDGCSCNHE